MKTMPDPEPLELTNPGLAEHFRQIANRVHPVVHALQIKMGSTVVYLKNGTKRTFEFAGRNDPCPCGSSKKFKKCCMSVVL